MKKSLKTLGCLSLAMLLVACGGNGSVLTVDEAKARATDIEAYQEEHAEDLYKDGIHYSASIEEKDEKTENKKLTSKVELWYYNSDTVQFARMKIEQSYDGKNQTMDQYLGKIDDKYYALNAVEKQYVVYPDKATFDADFQESTLELLVGLLTMSSPSAIIDSILEDADADDMTNTFKSKGDGHLYVLSEMSATEEDVTYEYKAEMVWENYRLVSMDTSESFGEEYQKTTSKMDYKVDPRMPSLSGYTEAQEEAE